MKKIILFILPFLITGCMSYVELSNLDVVENLKIDYKNEEFIIQATTTYKEEEENKQIVITANGKTIEDAVKNIKVQQNKKFYIAHLNLLILTEDVVNNKLEEIITYFINNTESRNDFSMVLANDFDLSKVNQDNLSERIRIIEEDMGLSKSIEFEGFLKDLLENKKSVLPVININEEIKISTIALVIDNKIDTYLNEDETILYNMLHNYLYQAQIFDANILSTQTYFNFKDSKLTVSIECFINSKQENFSKILEKSIKEMYDKYKEQEIDVFDFGNYIKKSDPSFYKKFEDDLINNIDIKINVEVKTNTDKHKEDILS